MLRRVRCLVGAACALGCSAPMTAVHLDRPARAAGPRAVSVDEVAVSDDVWQAGFHPSSRAAVRVQLANDTHVPQSYRILEATLELRDLSGAPQFHSGQTTVKSHGFQLPPSPAYTVPPGASYTLVLEFADFPWHESDRPMRATLHLPAENDEPVDVVLADVTDSQAPRWPMRRPYPFWRTSWRTMGGAANANVLDILGAGTYWSRGRPYLGFAFGFGFLFNEALLAGPPAFDGHLSIDGGWLPYRHCCGVFASAEFLLAFFNAPYADRYLRGTGPHSYPNLSAGLVFKGGRARGPSGLLPIDFPATGLGSTAIRAGYVRWFNTGAPGGSDGLLISWEVTL